MAEPAQPDVELGVDPDTDRTPSRRTEIGDESRRRILDAAEKLFIERGVSQTSFAKIEREAGISRGSIPWHFTNKRGLLLSILDRAMLLGSSDYSDLAGRSGIRSALARARAKLHRPQAVLLSVLLSESLHADSETNGRYRQFHADTRRAIIDLLERSDDIELPVGLDEDALSTIVVGALIGIHLQYRVAPDLVDLDAAIDDLADLLDSVLDPG